MVDGQGPCGCTVRRHFLRFFNFETLRLARVVGIFIRKTLRLQAEKKAGRGGWAAIRWRQRLYEDMGIELARANYRMLMERTLPSRVGG